MRAGISMLVSVVVLLGCTAVGSGPAVGGSGSTSTSVDTGAHVTADDAMVIDGVIRGRNLHKLEEAILAKRDGTVDLVINSPGGSVGTGFRFVSVMEDARARGIRFNCYVGGMAASMAFQILLHCDEKHALDRSFLLWHRARIMLGGSGGPLTAPQLAVMSADLESTDRVILEEVATAMPDFAGSITYHFENETMHVGENLGQLTRMLTSHPAIPGLFEALSNKKLPRTEEESLMFPFGGDVVPPMRNDLGGFEFGEIIYIK